MSEDAFFVVRDRAFDLAATARYRDWRQIAHALQSEGFSPSLISRLDRDGLAVMMLTRCCSLART
jgi:hypothetical protein